MRGEYGIRTEGGVGIKAESGGQQFVDVGTFELRASVGLEILLRRVGEFFDGHDQPFLNLTVSIMLAYVLTSATWTLSEAENQVEAELVTNRGDRV